MVLDRAKLKKFLKEKGVTLDISCWKCCDQQDEKSKARNFHYLGCFHEMLGNYSRALEFYINARDICEKTGDKELLKRILLILVFFI